MGSVVSMAKTNSTILSMLNNKIKKHNNFIYLYFIESHVAFKTL